MVIRMAGFSRPNAFGSVPVRVCFVLRKDLFLRRRLASVLRIQEVDLALVVGNDLVDQQFIHVLLSWILTHQTVQQLLLGVRVHVVLAHVRRFQRVIFEVVDQVLLLAVHLLVDQEPGFAQRLDDLDQINLLINFTLPILRSPILASCHGAVLVLFVTPSKAAAK